VGDVSIEMFFEQTAGEVEVTGFKRVENHHMLAGCFLAGDAGGAAAL